MPRILIADDNAENLYFLQILLRGHQFAVTTATNGAEALASALESPPDVIVTDILMPVMDGFALCREWKSNERLKGIPFIFYTATYTEQKDEEFALSLGADRFVVKPQEPDVLMGIITDVLERGQSRKETYSGEEAREESKFLKEYSEALFRKLEKKMADLESTNKALRATIGDLQKAEVALKASEAKYRNIFENAVMGIFRTDGEGRYLDLNRAFAGMFGFASPEEMMDVAPLMEERLYLDCADWRRLRDAMAGHGAVEDFEAALRTKDGGSVWISMNMRAYQDEERGGLIWEGTAKNVTRRKTVEDEKRHLESQLRQSQKMEAIGTLAGGIAHDFNNILTAIIGYASLLQMDTERGDPKKVYIDQILASSQKAANLTQSLLAFSRKQVIELKPLRVRTVIREMEKILSTLLTEDIDLKIEPIDERLTIMADLTQIDQVLLNLVANARDAMPEGGALVIETREVETLADLPEVLVPQGEGSYALISVSDTGVGMDEATREKIFEPFFTTKQPGKGTGLGLSTVYGIVKQHDGHITVHSEPGRGTTFRIYLPSARSGVEEKTEKSRELTRGNETVLVAEDNGELRTLMKDVLSRAGYSVIIAVDGDDAVQKFTEHTDRIDLLILDVVMPRKNGQVAFEEIKKIKPDARVLFTSGYTGDIVLDKGIRNDLVDFLSKPLPPGELLAKVRQILDRGGAPG